MMQIEKSKVEEIVKLHSEIVGHLRMSLEKAIRIGQLLTEQKESLKHGEFTPWLKTNIPFTDRTAQNYMRLYRERDRIKTETVSDLKCAYSLLAPPKEREQEEKGEDTPTYTDEFLNSICPFTCYMETVLLDESDPETAKRWKNKLPQDTMEAWRAWVQIKMRLSEKSGDKPDEPCKLKKPLGYRPGKIQGQGVQEVIQVLRRSRP